MVDDDTHRGRSRREESSLIDKIGDRIGASQSRGRTLPWPSIVVALAAAITAAATLANLLHQLSH